MYPCPHSRSLLGNLYNTTVWSDGHTHPLRGLQPMFCNLPGAAVPMSPLSHKYSVLPTACLAITGHTHPCFCVGCQRGRTPAAWPHEAQ
jgi:hypothetical protein